MVEVTVTVLLLMIAMTATLEVVARVARERQAVERRQCALEEAANLMERLSARRWGRLVPDAVRGLGLSPRARRLLPGGELSVDVAGEGDSKRLAVQVRWKDRSGNWDGPVRVSSWVFRRRDER